MDPAPIPGLHHVTAISGPPQANLDFYAGPLRQRLVKRTVNFDDPGTYHLYYGDEEASPGSILTFFPFVGAAPGRPGPGMASAFAYTVPALDPWTEALAAAGIAADGPRERLGERVLTLRDPDGLTVDLIERASPEPEADARTEGFHSVTLWLADPEPTARLLTDLMGLTPDGEAREVGSTRLRLRAEGGSAVDLLRTDQAAAARSGAGTIHHVAFRAPSPEAQQAWRERLLSAGFDVTPVIDRQYFNAIYFREPGGVLFEIATDPPGFAVDEAPESLGTALKLPPRYEAMRDRIEATLPPLDPPRTPAPAGTA